MTGTRRYLVKRKRTFASMKLSPAENRQTVAKVTTDKHLSLFSKIDSCSHGCTWENEAAEMHGILKDYFLCQSHQWKEETRGIFPLVE